MFCKNCGKENADGAGYCAACGWALNQAAPTPEADSGNRARAQKKPVPKIPLLTACAVLALLFVFYQIALHATKPETIIKNHMTALISGDYGAVYDSLDIPEGTFTSKEQFLACYAFPVDGPANKITSLAMTQATAKDLKCITPLPGNVVASAYQVVYSTQLEPTPSTEIILLTQKGKAFLFFDRYKVEPHNFIAQDYHIAAPAGVTVSFDGIELDNTFLTQAEIPKNAPDGANTTQTNIYTLPNPFFGAHKITVQSDYTEDYEGPIFVKSGQTESIDNLVIKPDIRAQMRKTTEETLHLFFDAMVANKSFSEISPQLTLAPDQVDAIRAFYDSLQNISWSGADSRSATTTNLRILSIADDAQANSTLTGRPEAPLSYRLKYTVSCDVEPKSGYILFGNRHPQRSFYISIDFSYENGELKIYDVRS